MSCNPIYPAPPLSEVKIIRVLSDNPLSSKASTIFPIDLSRASIIPE